MHTRHIQHIIAIAVLAIFAYSLPQVRSTLAETRVASEIATLPAGANTDGGLALPEGCRPGFDYSVVNGRRCTIVLYTETIEGCEAGFSFSPKNGRRCVHASPTPTPTQSSSHQPYIISTTGKAAGNFEVDAGGKTGVTGRYLGGNSKNTTHVYVGGIEATIVQLGDDLLYFIVPPVLSSGSTHDLYVVNEKGKSNVVRVKVIGRQTQVQANPSVTPSPSPITTHVSLQEIWTTGFSFKHGDIMTINVRPTYIQPGYKIVFEAWNEANNEKVETIATIDCKKDSPCPTTTTWKLKDSLFKTGDRKFILRASLFKGDSVLNRIQTGKVYVIGPDSYVSAPQPSQTPAAAIGGAPVSMALSAEKAIYNQGEPIKVNLKAYNTTDAPVTLTFNSGCPRTVYSVGSYNSSTRVSSECTGTAQGPSVVIKPKSAYYWQIIHDQATNPISAGNHTFTATPNATNKDQYPGVSWSASLPIKVLAPGIGATVFEGVRSLFELVF